MPSMMTFLSYNDISLEIITTEQHLMEPVWSDDGADLLHVRHTLRISCIFNPEATSYKEATSPHLSPVAVKGEMPPDTERAIRHKLSEPRKQLVFAVGGVIVLFSPEGGKTVDATCGPIPRVLNVKQVIGTKCFMVEFEVTTDIYECKSDASLEYPIVSNRYNQTHHIDNQRLTTIVTRGVAVFRSDRLEAEPDPVKRRADFFRSRVIPGCPNNFQRKAMTIGVNTIGNILTYEVQDREQMFSLGATDNLARYQVEDFQAVQAYNSVTVPVGDDGHGVPGNKVR